MYPIVSWNSVCTALVYSGALTTISAPLFSASGISVFDAAFGLPALSAKRPSGTKNRMRVPLTGSGVNS